MNQVNVVHGVNDTNDAAYFAGQTIKDIPEDLLIGDWLFIRAEDGGEPGADKDLIEWKWLGDDAETAIEMVANANRLTQEKEIVAEILQYILIQKNERQTA